jgi:hypothetical protein
MKNLMLTFAALLFLGTATFAQSDSPKSTDQKEVKVKKEMKTQDQDVKKKEINLNELPAPIQKKLKSKEMAPWKPTAAYLNKDGIYIIKVMNGKNIEETKELKFNKDGTKVEK